MPRPDPEPLPPITPELAVLSILLEAHLRASKPAARARLVRAIGAVLDERECSVPMVRPATQTANVLRVRRLGARWLKRLIAAMEAR